MAVARAAVAGGADYIEAGTPLIKSEGLDAVRELRRAFPDKTIIADMKTMDAGKIETEAAAKAGANVVTVIGSATGSTIRECVEAGKHYGAQVAVDLLGVSDPVAFAAAAGELGVAWLDVHCAIDAQMHGADPLDLLKQIRQVTDLTLAVAGGLNSETAAAAAAAGADVIIIGGAITKATDPAAATADIRKAIDTQQAVTSELFKRATDDDVRHTLAAVRTSNISDGSHRLPCLAGLRQLVSGTTAIGPAVTVRTLPGDWIVADDDGVMVLPRARAVEMANRAANVLEAENRIRQEIRDQQSTLAKVVNLARWEKHGGPAVG